MTVYEMTFWRIFTGLEQKTFILQNVSKICFMCLKEFSYHQGYVYLT